MIIDIAVAIVILISALIAFIRGFIREILTIAGVVSGVFAAWLAAPLLAPVFQGWFGVDPNAEEPQKLFNVVPLEWVADGCAYFLIFITVVIIISVLSHFLAESLRALGLGAVDRTLGVIFGIARGVLLVGLFYLPFYLFMENASDSTYLKDSKTAFYLDHTAEFLAEFFPDDLDKMDEDDTSDTRQKLQDLKLLKKENANNGEAGETLEPITIDKNDLIDGYKNNFRNNMDELFEQKQDQQRLNNGYNE